MTPCLKKKANTCAENGFLVGGRNHVSRGHPKKLLQTDENKWLTFQNAVLHLLPLYDKHRDTISQRCLMVESERVSTSFRDRWRNMEPMVHFRNLGTFKKVGHTSFFRTLPPWQRTDSYICCHHSDIDRITKIFQPLRLLFVSKLKKITRWAEVSWVKLEALLLQNDNND